MEECKVEDIEKGKDVEISCKYEFICFGIIRNRICGGMNKL